MMSNQPKIIALSGIHINRSGAYLALLAALLFGVSTPFAKILLEGVDAILLAGVLYLGAGLGLAFVLIVRRIWRRSRPTTEAPLVRKDLPWLVGAVIFGGVAGPLLLMVGLQKTSAANASLLLNSEAVLTAALAWTVFREHFEKRIVWGMLAIVTGAVILSWAGRPEGSAGTGELLIALACLAWAVDNNVTRMISGGDPQIIACVKGLIAGVVNITIGLAHGSQLPSGSTLGMAAVVGLVGYGISLQLYVVALRHIGTARTGAYFTVAPFAGAAVALLMFRTPLTVSFISAALLMALGVWLHLTERHVHEHIHEGIFHEHKHAHDEHHEHPHGHEISQREPHSHPHAHETLRHTHAHYPDLHHRHPH
jgi:drug/metabolite transporter (DMT)-like permease